MITSLFGKKIMRAVEEGNRVKEICFLRVLMREARKTGRYYFPCAACSLEKYLMSNIRGQESQKKR